MGEAAEELYHKDHVVNGASGSEQATARSETAPGSGHGRARRPLGGAGLNLVGDAPSFGRRRPWDYDADGGEDTSVT